jgi:hypothetical protein
MEDRLNPIAPEGADEATLGGYMALHGRAPGFEGSDGMPYTVALETERDEVEGWAAYLVFIRWANNSTAIMGHLTTDDLHRAPSEVEAKAGLEHLLLMDVKRLLDEAIDRERDWNS